MSYERVGYNTPANPDLDGPNLARMEDGIEEAHGRFTLTGLDADIASLAPGVAGRLYVATDKPRIYRDTGSAWELKASLSWGDFEGKPEIFPPAPHTHGPADVKRTKLSYLAFGGTGNASGTAGLSRRTDLTSFHVRNEIRLSVSTNKLRLKLRNFEARGEVAVAGAIDVIGVWIGEHAPDADGNWTGNFAAAPRQLFGAAVLPADGGEISLGPAEAENLQLKANTPYVLSVAYVCRNANQQIVQGSNRAYVGGAGTAASATALTNPISGFSNQPFSMLLEYEYDSGEPVLMVVGDSISEGTGARLGQRHNWLTQLALGAGCPAICAGIGGSQASEWVPSGGPGYKYTRFDYQNPLFSVEAFVLALGRNDFSAGRTDGQIIANLQSILNFVRNNIKPKKIYLATILPTTSAGWTVQQETYRRAVNDWIRTLPAGVASVIDFDRLMSETTRGAAGLSVTSRGEWSSATAYAVDDMVWYRHSFWRATAANTNSAPVLLTNWQQIFAMHASHDSGDGIHPSEAGQARMAHAAAVVGPAVGIAA